MHVIPSHDIKFVCLMPVCLHKKFGLNHVLLLCTSTQQLQENLLLFLFLLLT